MSEPATLDASTAALEPVPDRRSERRLRSLLTGTIVFDDKCTMDCTVRNISAFGARVVLADAFRLPDTFNLRIPHHDQTHRARTVWRKGDAAGLELADVEEMPRAPRHRLTRRDSTRLHRKELDAPMF